MEPFRYIPGTIPLLISIPHCGTYVPEGILARLTPAAKQLPDTDWHVDRLYDFARELGAHMLIATHSRYVIDLNRGPDNASLYPGQFTTGLCPTTLFDGSPLYLEGEAPDADEILQRRAQYWQPYHDKILQWISEHTETYPKVAKRVLFDAHSIASQVPLLFEGRLPDLNLGTADGKTVPPALGEKLIGIAKASDYSAAYNGRFKGGYITRHYGDPARGMVAVQLELAQCNYMHETAPYAYDEDKAYKLQKVLRSLLAALGEEISK